jgi:hypothetical protein
VAYLSLVLLERQDLIRSALIFRNSVLVAMPNALAARARLPS